MFLSKASFFVKFVKPNNENLRELTNNNSGNGSINWLPTELIFEVLNNLPLKDQLAFRVTSNKFKKITTEYCWINFNKHNSDKNISTLIKIRLVTILYLSDYPIDLKERILAVQESIIHNDTFSFYNLFPCDYNAIAILQNEILSLVRDQKFSFIRLIFRKLEDVSEGLCKQVADLIWKSLFEKLFYIGVYEKNPDLYEKVLNYVTDKRVDGNYILNQICIYRKKELAQIFFDTNEILNTDLTIACRSYCKPIINSLLRIKTIDLSYYTNQVIASGFPRNFDIYSDIVKILRFNTLYYARSESLRNKLYIKLNDGGNCKSQLYVTGEKFGRLNEVIPCGIDVFGNKNAAFQRIIDVAFIAFKQLSFEGNRGYFHSVFNELVNSIQTIINVYKNKIDDSEKDDFENLQIFHKFFENKLNNLLSININI